MASLSHLETMPVSTSDIGCRSEDDVDDDSSLPMSYLCTMDEKEINFNESISMYDFSLETGTACTDLTGSSFFTKSTHLHESFPELEDSFASLNDSVLLVIEEDDDHKEVRAPVSAEGSPLDIQEEIKRLRTQKQHLEMAMTAKRHRRKLRQSLQQNHDKKWKGAESEYDRVQMIPIRSLTIEEEGGDAEDTTPLSVEGSHRTIQKEIEQLRKQKQQLEVALAAKRQRSKQRRFFEKTRENKWKVAEGAEDRVQTRPVRSATNDDLTKKRPSIHVKRGNREISRSATATSVAAPPSLITLREARTATTKASVSPERDHTDRSVTSAISDITAPCEIYLSEAQRKLISNSPGYNSRTVSAGKARRCSGKSSDSKSCSMDTDIRSMESTHIGNSPSRFLSCCHRHHSSTTPRYPSPTSNELQVVPSPSCKTRICATPSASGQQLTRHVTSISETLSMDSDIDSRTTANLLTGHQLDSKKRYQVRGCGKLSPSAGSSGGSGKMPSLFVSNGQTKSAAKSSSRSEVPRSRKGSRVSSRGSMDSFSPSSQRADSAADHSRPSRERRHRNSLSQNRLSRTAGSGIKNIESKSNRKDWGVEADGTSFACNKGRGTKTTSTTGRTWGTTAYTNSCRDDSKQRSSIGTKRAGRLRRASEPKTRSSEERRTSNQGHRSEELRPRRRSIEEIREDLLQNYRGLLEPTPRPTRIETLPPPPSYILGALLWASRNGLFGPAKRANRLSIPKKGRRI